jgi:hypothetical protein
VNQMQIDVDETRCHLVALPDLVEQTLRHWH